MLLNPPQQRLVRKSGKVIYSPYPRTIHKKEQQKKEAHKIKPDSTRIMVHKLIFTRKIIKGKIKSFKLIKMIFHERESEREG